MFSEEYKLGFWTSTFIVNRLFIFSFYFTSIFGLAKSNNNISTIFIVANSSSSSSSVVTVPSLEFLKADLANETNETASNGNETASDGMTLNCPENFFFNENSSTCVPICGQFSFFEPGVEILNQVAVCLCFIGSAVMLVLSLTINRKKL